VQYEEDRANTPLIIIYRRTDIPTYSPPNINTGNINNRRGVNRNGDYSCISIN